MIDEERSSAFKEWVITLTDLIKESLGYNPTMDQSAAVEQFAALLYPDEQYRGMLLKGYAGTGKTSLIAALTKVAPRLGYTVVLLAPTGRAAKVLSSYTDQIAYTIHKYIYRSYTLPTGSVGFRLQANLLKRAIFIVDEASMIQSEEIFLPGSEVESRNLLDDLIRFVKYGKGCRLLVSGDSAQLPPVGSENSFALDVDTLSELSEWRFLSYEMTEVVRQAKKSGILYNATFLREKINAAETALPFFTIHRFTDFQVPDAGAFSDLFANAFSHKDSAHAVVICRSNKRANLYNNQIRNRILYREAELSAGDRLMVVKNNYYWLPSESSAGFIANGDIIEVKRIQKIVSLYSLKFAIVEVSLPDFDIENLETILLLDTLSSESAALTQNESRRFFEEVMQDYADEPNRRKRVQKVREDKWFNALQVKFAYALTCHKTQGGQWSNVFIDAPYNPENQFSVSDLKWLYTAITRATKQVWLAGFGKEYFVDL